MYDIICLLSDHSYVWVTVYDNVIQASEVEKPIWFELLQIHVYQVNVYYLIIHILGNEQNLFFPLYLFSNGVMDVSPDLFKLKNLS